VSVNGKSGNANYQIDIVSLVLECPIPRATGQPVEHTVMLTVDLLIEESYQSGARFA
jgi:hypothetical protein